MKPLKIQVWRDHLSRAHTTNWVPSSGWPCYRSSTVYIYIQTAFLR